MPKFQKRIKNPIPPEYANVFVLKLITIAVGIICLMLTSYATWTVFTMSNRIAAYHTSLEAAAIADRVSPIDFRVLDSVSSTEHEKQTFTLPPVTHDVFYNTSITSTDTDFSHGFAEILSTSTIRSTPTSTIIVTTTTSSTYPL